jgi:hypothetical protein
LNLRKTVTNVVVIVIESEEPYVAIFFWRKKVRNANGEGSSWKSAANKTHMAKYLLLKMPVITLMKKKK